MAFGKNKNNPNSKLFTFKIRSRDNNKKEVPVFLEVTEKIGNDYVVQTEPATYVEGTLVALEHDERLWDGGKGEVLLQNAKVHLVSGNNRYILTVPYNILGRGVINSLVNLKTFDNIEISVYMSKGEKSYPAAIVRQNNVRVDWKYAIDQLPKPTKFTTSKGVISDFGDLDKFFINEVKTFGTQLGATRKASPGEAVSESTEIPETATEDVPF